MIIGGIRMVCLNWSCIWVNKIYSFIWNYPKLATKKILRLNHCFSFPRLSRAEQLRPRMAELSRLQVISGSYGKFWMMWAE